MSQNPKTGSAFNNHSHILYQIFEFTQNLKQSLVIPCTEMMINLVKDEAHDYKKLIQRQNKILGNMLGCEIDFIIKGFDNSSHSVIASRKNAMYKKRQIFVSFNNINKGQND